MLGAEEPWLAERHSQKKEAADLSSHLWGAVDAELFPGEVYEAETHPQASVAAAVKGLEKSDTCLDHLNEKEKIRCKRRDALENGLQRSESYTINVT